MVDADNKFASSGKGGVMDVALMLQILALVLVGLVVGKQVSLFLKNRMGVELLA